MRVHENLLSLIGKSEALTALIDDRVYHIKAPQSVQAPYIVFSDSGSQPDEHLSGPAGFVKGRFEMIIYSEDAGQLPDLYEALRQSLQGLREGEIKSIHAGDTIEGYDEEVELPFISADFVVLYGQQQHIGA